MAVLALRHRLFIAVMLLLHGITTVAQTTPDESQESFADCITRLQQHARAQDLSVHAVDQVLGSVQYSAKVIELDRRQPEFAETFANYLNKRVDSARIERGRQLLSKHHRLLLQLQQRYGVQPQYLLSFWGLETNYGSYTGNMPVLDSLATLACDPRRSDFFTAELMHALHIVDSGVAPEQMRGSWAGAMGQTQFMPSVYMRFARDGDGDGTVDLWHSTADALTSAAAFLADLGWQAGWRWGREVILPSQFPYLQTGRNQRQPLSTWRDYGVTTTLASAYLISMSQQLFWYPPATAARLLRYTTISTLSCAGIVLNSMPLRSVIWPIG